MTPRYTVCFVGGQGDDVTHRPPAHERNRPCGILDLTRVPCDVEDSASLRGC